MVLESARHHLTSLKPLSKKLNDATDAFTGELRSIEDELNELGIGLEVMVGWPIVGGDLVEVTDDGDGTVQAQYRDNLYLAYGRYLTGWRLLVRTFRDYEDPRLADTIDRSVLQRDTPLVDAARDVRIAAAEKIGDLLKLIATEAKQKIESLDKAIDKK